MFFFYNNISLLISIIKTLKGWHCRKTATRVGTLYSLKGIFLWILISLIRILYFKCEY